MTFQNLSNSGPYSNVASLVGGTATLSITGATADLNGYQYQADFSNALGMAMTTPAALTVEYAPVADDPISETVFTNGIAYFAATETSGNPTATTVQWQISTDGGKSFQNLSNTAPYSGVTTLNGATSTLIISMPLPQ